MVERAAADGVQAVCLDNDVLTMTGLSATLTTDGVRGENIIREYDEGMTITLRRPVRDMLGAMPGIEVSIDVPSIKAKLSDHQYRLITSIAQDNLREPLALPLAAQWMKNYMAGPDAGVGAAPSTSGTPPPTAEVSRALEGAPADAAGPARQLSKPPPAPGGDRAARTTIRVVVNLGRAELEMLRTVAATGELAPLARFSVTGAWVAYRSTYDDRGATVPHVGVVDADKAGVTEPRRGAPLDDETRGHLGDPLGRRAGRHQRLFDGHNALELRIPAAPHDGHGAAADLALKDVVCKVRGHGGALTSVSGVVG